MYAREDTWLPPFPRTIEIRAPPISLRESWLSKSLSLKRKGEEYYLRCEITR